MPWNNRILEPLDWNPELQKAWYCGSTATRQFLKSHEFKANFERRKKHSFDAITKTIEQLFANKFKHQTCVKKIRKLVAQHTLFMTKPNN